MENDRRVESLSCTLTDDEVRQRDEQAAVLQRDRDEAEAERDAANKIAKGQVSSLESRIRHLLGEIRARSTFRDVEVMDVRDDEGRTIDRVRLDTSEIIRSRPQTPDERQVKLFPADEKVAEGA